MCLFLTYICEKFSRLAESMSEKFSNLWLLGKADVEAVDALFLQHVTWNVIQFNLIEGDGLGVCALFRAARSQECNLIQINKMDWVYALG